MEFWWIVNIPDNFACYSISFIVSEMMIFTVRVICFFGCFKYKTFVFLFLLQRYLKLFNFTCTTLYNQI